jgi:endonuclease/exonuclease/phosphatase family metal-dependent hydrolase
MPSRLKISMFAAAIAAFCSAFDFAAQASGSPTEMESTRVVEGPQVTLMSFNLLHSLNPLPPSAWRYRRPLAWHVIHQHAPDVIALQEVLNDQLKDFTREFGQTYEFVGHGHGGPRSGEILPVAWKRERFELVAHEFFWLSPTPTVVGSKGWGGMFPRVVTLVRLRERESGREFLVINNHWEANNDLMEARLNSARMLLERTAHLPAELPVFLVGDFNVVPTRKSRREPYRLLTEEGSPPAFCDAWLTAATRTGPDTTTNRLHPAPNLQAGERKDWVLFRGPVQIGRFIVDDYHRDRLYPSDHLPLVVEFSWSSEP